MGRRVARRLPGRHSSVAARPLRCRTGFFAGRSTSDLVPSGGLLPAGTGLGTSLEQYVERLSHDRTTVGHWQSPIFTPEGYSGTPRQPTPRLLGQLLCDYHQSLLAVELDQAGTGDTHRAHSGPVRRVVGTVG